MTMPDILSAFANESLFAASAKFLQHLGVKFSTQTEEPIPFLELYEEAATEANATIPKDIKAIFSRVENTYFIGTVTDDTLNGENAGVDFKVEAAKPKYEGMFVFAVEMKPGETLKRSEAAVLVRGINRVVKQMPATVLILEKHHAHTEARRHGGEDDLCDSVTPCEICLSVATCERTEYRQSWRPGERLGKVSILKGVNTLSPHRGHIDILESMNVKACKTFDALYKQWKDVFSTSLLTKQFYREIQNWYFWALKKEQHVAFPNALDDDSDDEKYNAENIIRLITRLIFTWFMKEKGLVNPDLFNPEFLKTALKSFNPDGTEFFRQDLQDAQDFKDNPVNHVNPVLKQENSCTYYRAILQNLFFATFNQEVGLRDFVDTQVRDAKRYNIKNYYRNEKLFTETDKAKIISYFNGSPFVNGGLFECLDNVEQNGRVYSWDGFSNSVHFKDGSLKSALIPDCLFFGGETTADLSEFFEKDKSAKNVKVRGIINILNDYVFTIEENTPFDEDVALDPELLGKVFENLLGCYNPETQQMARNATGSFYTPREIVNYMVKVTLKSYLKRACPKVVLAEIDALVEGVAELAEMPSVKEYAKDILTALFKAKILDPACGSGAFPMGIMSAMVEILRTVDPDNKHWYEIVLKESLDEAASIADVGDEQERAILKAQIEYDFKERVDHPDYARKLYIIEHCIFGSDIQPIAVQISRLRFFITLLCEQTKNDDPTKNYGITPLPNLESNFVAANSLLSIDLKDMRELLGQKKIVSLVKQLRGIRHQLFLPKTSDKKKRLQKKDEELRQAIAAAAEGLYDENIEQKCAMLEADIRRCDEELAKLVKDDFKDVTKEVEEVDLFGEKTVKTQKVVGKGNILLKKKKDAESALASLKNASRKEKLLTDLKRLVAWNPFAFNVAETFLDPEWMFGVKEGFDIVIGNPPYGLVNKRQNKGVAIVVDEDTMAYYKDSPEFQEARGRGTINIYRLFIQKSLELLSNSGVFSEIFPLAFAGDLSAASLRKYVFSNYQTISFDAFPERDNPAKRVFEAAKMSVCILSAVSAKPQGDMLLRINTDKYVDYDGESFYLPCKSLLELDPEYGRLPIAGEMDYRVLFKVRGAAQRLATVSRCATGELDMTFAKAAFTTDPSLPEMIRGAGVGRFVIRKELSQGERLFIDETKVKNLDKIHSLKDQERIAMQGITGVNEVWRLKGTLVSGVYCANSVNYIVKIDNMRFLLGVFNSRLMNFYFARFSTNSNVNGYEVDELPLILTNVSVEQKMDIANIVDAILAAKKSDQSADTSALEAEIDEKVFDLYNLTPEEREIVKGNGR